MCEMTIVNIWLINISIFELINDVASSWQITEFDI
jgi:hypothetical protein